MNETAPVQKQDIEQIVELLVAILAELRKLTTAAKAEGQE